MGEEFKLFVGGLAWAIDDDKLWELFKPFGEVPFARSACGASPGRRRSVARWT